jgi:hypothetical protein
VDSSQRLKWFLPYFSNTCSSKEIGETDALHKHVERNERQEAGKYDKDFHSLHFGSVNGIRSGSGTNRGSAPTCCAHADGWTG